MNSFVDLPAILAAKTHDVRSFIRGEMAQREDVGYPPFSRMALVRVDGGNEVVTSTEAARLSELARSVSPDVLVLGPAAAPLRRLRSRFRFQLMLRADDRNELRKALLLIARSPLVRGVRASIDVDPLSML